jgi:hypothetical protein
VDALLGMYEIGVLQTPDFGQVWGVALSAKGLRMVTLRDSYAAWVDFLYMVVEIENAVTNDFRIRGEPFTDAETFDHVLLTPSKVQQLGLAHERLVSSYLAHILGEPIEALWALTVGLTGRNDLDVRWMRQTLDSIQSSDDAQAVTQLSHVLRARLKEDTNDPDSFAWLCDLLEQEDRHILRDLKLTLREGVMIFESLERDTIRLGGPRLVTILQSIPAILEGFYQRIFSQL